MTTSEQSQVSVQVPGSKVRFRVGGGTSCTGWGGVGVGSAGSPAPVGREADVKASAGQSSRSSMVAGQGRGLMGWAGPGGRLSVRAEWGWRQLSVTWGLRAAPSTQHPGGLSAAHRSTQPSNQDSVKLSQAPGRTHSAQNPAPGRTQHSTWGLNQGSRKTEHPVRTQLSTQETVGLSPARSTQEDSA